MPVTQVRRCLLVVFTPHCERRCPRVGDPMGSLACPFPMSLSSGEFSRVDILPERAHSEQN
jgi:hypothetical protein